MQPVDEVRWPMKARLPVDDGTLDEFCRRRGIRKLALFGSVLRGTARPDSDIDLLVEFERHAVPDLLRLVEIEEELSALVGRKIDLRTPGDLSHYFRDRIVQTAEVQYERG
jgi:hypothetical protein